MLVFSSPSANHQQMYVFFIFFVVLFFFFFLYNRCSRVPLPISRDVVVVEKSREKGDRENNARPKPFKLPVLACRRCFSRTPLRMSLHVFISFHRKQEERKREKNRTKTLHLFSLLVSFSLYILLEVFTFFFSSKKNGNSPYSLFSVFLLLSNVTTDDISLHFASLHLKRTHITRKKERNE